MLYRSLTLLWLLWSMVLAETPEEIAKRSYMTNINALLIFTSQKGLNSGKYQFTNINTQMEVINAPFRYDFESSTRFNLFMKGNGGYSKVTLTEPRTDLSPGDGKLDYDSMLQTYAGGLGFGIRYQSPFGLDLSSGLEFIYSRTGINLKNPDEHKGDAIVDFFHNKYNDNLTTALMVEMSYDKELARYKLHADTGYKLYETKAAFNFDALSSFSTQASVISVGIGAETPAYYDFSDYYLTLEGYANAYHIFGDVTNVIGFTNYRIVGLKNYLYTTKSEWFERYYIEVSTARSDGLEGYNIGIGFSLR